MKTLMQSVRFVPQEHVPMLIIFKLMMLKHIKFGSKTFQKFSLQVEGFNLI